MRNRALKKMVNALTTQKRLILQLECGHNLGLSPAETDALGGETGIRERLIASRGQWPCPICPDLPSQLSADEAFRRATFGQEE